MKIKVLFSLAILSLFLFSCGSDDEDSIVGNWVVESINSTNCDDPEDNISATFTDGEFCLIDGGESFCFGITLNISEGGNMTFTITSTFLGQSTTETDTYTYTTNGDEITVCITDSECSVSNYQLDGNVLSFAFIDEDGCNVSMSLSRN